MAWNGVEWRGRSYWVCTAADGAESSPAARSNPKPAVSTASGLPAAIKVAADQLEAQARILAFVLATANAQLLEAHGPLQVVGTVEFAGVAPSPAKRQHWTGQQRGLGCSAAPKTAELAMELRVRP